MQQHLKIKWVHYGKLILHWFPSIVHYISTEVLFDRRQLRTDNRQWNLAPHLIKDSTLVYLDKSLNIDEPIIIETWNQNQSTVNAQSLHL